MKKLFNVSPFLLLLTPVFVIATFSITQLAAKNTNDQQLVTKTTLSSSWGKAISCLAK